MNCNRFTKLNLEGVPTPIHIIDEVQLQKNVAILADLQKQSGAKILFALKAFAQHSIFDKISPHVSGATASSLNEALHAHKEFAGELHLCAPAYPPSKMTELAQIADHIVFNSFKQKEIFEPHIKQSSRPISMGIRINPEHSEGKVEVYDPCAPNSRLGVRIADFKQGELEGVEGLHFHTLCEQLCAPLERTLKVVEEKFSIFFDRLKWINFGGGHLITAPEYDRQALIKLIKSFRSRYPHLQVYMEPGEAFVIQTGVLVSQVLDIVSGPIPVAILDVSAAAHMPDVLEMPYRPDILHSGKLNEKEHNYQLAGLTCLAGDIIGDYSFDEPLVIGDKIWLLDMSHYTMVKNTNFNGVQSPAIAIANTNTGKLNLIKKFSYDDYRSRLS